MINNKMMSFKKSIPSILTLLNLFSGCMAILLSFHDIALAGMMVLLAGFFDFADGLAARLLDAYSDFGKELDSLADIVSFGVAPSFILFHLIHAALIKENPWFSIDTVEVAEIFILLTAFLPAMFTAIRLARFNITEGKKNFFMGLPSPAAGILFASLGYIVFTEGPGWITDLLLNTRVLLLLSICISLLMVLPVPMFTIKFKSFRLKGNLIRFIFLLPSFLLVVFWGLKAIPLVILYYILLSAMLTLIPGSEYFEKQP